jgi:hypothetical protein
MILHLLMPPRHLLLLPFLLFLLLPLLPCSSRLG